MFQQPKHNVMVVTCPALGENIRPRIELFVCLQEHSSPASVQLEPEIDVFEASQTLVVYRIIFQHLEIIIRLQSRDQCF